MCFHWLRTHSSGATPASKPVYQTLLSEFPTVRAREGGAWRVWGRYETEPPEGSEGGSDAEKLERGDSPAEVGSRISEAPQSMA